MKITLLIILFAAFMTSCKSKMIYPENLPKDVAMKKILNQNFGSDSTGLRNMEQEIVAMISTKNCDDPKLWKIAPMGTKPCGGPAYFIAYPIDMELNILPKIKTYSLQEAGFNEKYGIMSDCTMAEEPTGISCEKGKAVLEY